ncbi:MAG: type II secretion system protein [Planctomycetota bacterium]|jgi:prepilin-type N-terminal cleavage/methylation domain-containing protein/prepilin-type processing-associated H-X9-DG protein|nr:type II secretion system protein [Planctomycetota bacterium]
MRLSPLRSLIFKPARRGFTLIELLVATAVIVILMSLILMGVQNVRERAKIQHCQNNLREIGMAFNHYTYLWKGRLPPTTGVDDDNLRPLYPDCIDSLDAFECGGTGNEVNAPADLEDNAVGGRTSGRGTSYEYLSYYLFDKAGTTLSTPMMKTRANVDIRADKVWLVMDAMEAGIPQVPDLTDNHYEAGGNVLYADSHVEWIDAIRWTEEFQHGNSK